MSVHSAADPHHPAVPAPSRPGWGSVVFVAVFIVGVVLIVAGQ